MRAVHVVLDIFLAVHTTFKGALDVLRDLTARVTHRSPAATKAAAVRWLCTTTLSKGSLVTFAAVVVHAG